MLFILSSLLDLCSSLLTRRMESLLAEQILQRHLRLIRPHQILFDFAGSFGRGGLESVVEVDVEVADAVDYSPRTSSRNIA